MQHPLDQTPLHQALPFLRPLRKLFKKKKADLEKLKLVKHDANAQPVEEEKKETSPATKKSKTMMMGAKKQEAMDTSRLRNSSPKRKKKKHQHPLHMVGSDPLSLSGSFNAQPAETEFIKPVFKDKEDPANYLGYGIVSYFSLIKVLMATFALLSLVHLPVILTYGRYENYSNEILDNYQKVYSLGNMGFSGPRCVHVGLRVDNALLSCPTGSIRQVIDFGFISTDEDQNVCLRTLTDYECEQAYNRQSALASIESQCLERSSCLITNISSMLLRNATNYGLCSQVETQFFI